MKATEFSKNKKKKHWFIGHFWCLIVHNLIRDKHKMKKAYGPTHCEICGRVWEL